MKVESRLLLLYLLSQWQHNSALRGAEMKQGGNVEKQLSLVSGSLQLDISPTEGGCITGLTSLQNPEIQFLRKQKADSQQGVEQWVGHYPLIPFSNRIRDGVFTFRDQTISLKANIPGIAHAIHGFSFQSEWQVLERTQTYCHLRHIYTGHDWPWSYQADQYFSLTDNVFEHKMSVTNRSEQPMPAGLGFHPFLPYESGVCVAANIKKMFLQDDQVFPIGETDQDPMLTALQNNDPLLQGYDTGFFDWQGSATVSWPNHGYQLQIEAGETTPYAIIYTPKENDFFCFEPVSHATNALKNTEKDYQALGGYILDTDEVLSGWMRYSIID